MPQMRNKDFALLLIGSEKWKNELDGVGKLKLIFNKKIILGIKEMSFQSNNQIRLTFDSVTFDSYDSYVTYQNIEKFTEDLLNLMTMNQPYNS